MQRASLANRDLTPEERYLLGRWAGHCARILLPLFEAAWPGDARPRAALDGLDARVRGEAKLTSVKPLVLAAHAAAREAIADGEERAGIAARAADQAASVVHAARHALGPYYHAKRRGDAARLDGMAEALPTSLRARLFVGA